MILETVCVGMMQVNCYVLARQAHSPAVIIDPGAEPRKIKKILEKHSLTPVIVINTHGHYDHIGADDAFGVPVYIHREDAPLLKEPLRNLSAIFGVPEVVKSPVKTVEDNETITAAEMQLKVMHIPGHTPGGIALQLLPAAAFIVFTGDSLFFRGIGRSDLTDGNEFQLKKYIAQRLLTLPDPTVIYPGHGPSSSIGEEKIHNPYLS